MTHNTMKVKIIKILDFLIYWLVVLLPFSMAIAPAPMNIFMGFLIAGFLAKKIITGQIPVPRTGINTPLFLLFLITCVSLSNSSDPAGSIRGGILRQLQYIFVLFAVADSLKDKRHLKKVVFSLTFGLLLVSLDAVWQVHSGSSFIRPGYVPVVNIGLVRATSSFKDPNTMGIYLSGFAPLVFGLALYYFKNAAKVYFMLISLLVLSGTMLTFSRPALLAIYCAVLFLAIVNKDKALIIFILIFTLLSPFLLPRSVKNWAKEVQYNPLRFMCNDDRIAVYRNSLNMIRAHPFIGVGANAFMRSYKEYKEYPEYRNVVTLDEMKAHNIYLQLAGELGLIGLGIFLWLTAAIFLQGARIFRLLSGHYLKIAALSLIACLIAFLVNGLTESSLQYSRVAPVFWYSCGLLLALRKPAGLENERK